MLSHVLANKLLDFEMLAKHSPVYSKEHTAVLFSRTGFKIAKNIYILIFWYVCDSVFSQHKCFICGFSSGMYRGTVVHSTQKSDRVSLLNFYKPDPTRERYPSLHSQNLFTSSLFGIIYIYEQLFLRKSKISSKISYERLENSLRITTFKPDRCMSFRKTKSNIPLVPCSSCFFFPPMF